MSDSVRPHRRKPTRLPRPWDSPGKNAGVGYHCLSPMHESEKWKWIRSVVSDPQWPHGLQPSRLLHPWDFPGKSTGVGCHCLLQIYTLGVIKLWNSRSLWEKAMRKKPLRKGLLYICVSWLEATDAACTLWLLLYLILSCCQRRDMWLVHICEQIEMLVWRRQWQPTPVLLPGKSQGQRSLVGCCLWGHTESDTTEVT